MKRILLTLLTTLFLLNSYADVKVGDNLSLTKKDKKESAPVVKRAANFYAWYLNYIITNKNRPLHHPVIDQNTTKLMHGRAVTNTASYDVFLASDSLDEACTLEIIPAKIVKDTLSIQVKVSGKYTYSFHVVMKLFKENWCIDDVVNDEEKVPVSK